MMSNRSNNRWHWNNYRQEFERDGVGHPPIWKPDTVHGCEGGCSRDDFPGRHATIGDICLCGAGYVGVVLGFLHTGKWIGMHLGAGKIGMRWESKNPCVLGDMKEDETLRQFVIRTCPTGWKRRFDASP